MKKKYFFFLLLFSIYTGLGAQIKLSEYAEVSIVTAGPGNEFYEAFGHSAIRVQDPALNFDVIYNYVGANAEDGTHIIQSDKNTQKNIFMMVIFDVMLPFSI